MDDDENLRRLLAEARRQHEERRRQNNRERQRRFRARTRGETGEDVAKRMDDNKGRKLLKLLEDEDIEARAKRRQEAVRELRLGGKLNPFLLPPSFKE